MLEPYDGKLSRTVLRGGWDRKVLGPTRYLKSSDAVNEETQTIDAGYS